MENVPRQVTGFHILQKISMSLMAVLVLLTFIGSNLHALLWQSSEWLVSTVLPAVVVDLTNQERAEVSATPLQRNATLDEAAQLKAEHMARHEYFSHYSPEGVSPWHWFNEAGYVYAHAGENLAIHFSDSEEVVDAWMDSPTHRANIMNAQYTEIGVGTAKGEYEGYKTVYVVQLFGAPAIASVPVSQPEPTESVVTEVVSGESELALETTATPEPTLEIEVNHPVMVTEPVLVVPIAEVEDVVVQPETNILAEEAIVFSETVSESEIVDEPIVTFADDVVIIESPLMATSSGLAVAHIATPQDAHVGATVASIATRPNALLQSIYFVLGSLVVLMLLMSIALEVRRLHFVQVAYGLALMLVMGGLWYAHSLLTTGAVIV